MKYLYTLIAVLSIGLTAHATTYYYSGTGDLSVATNWWTNTDGTGSQPANFSTTTDEFDLYGRSGSMNSSWPIYGTVSNSQVTTSVITIVGSVQLSFYNVVNNADNIEIAGTNGTVVMGRAGDQDIPIDNGTFSLQLTSSGTKTAQGDISASILAFSGLTNLDMQSHTLSVGGTLNASGTHTLYTASVAATPIPSYTYPSGVRVTYTLNTGSTQYIPSGCSFEGGLTIVSNGNVEASGDIDVSIGLSLIGSLDMSTYQLTGTYTVSGSGVLSTANTSSAPFTASQTFGTVDFTASGNQTIPSGTTVSTLGIQGSGTKTADGDVTINSILGFTGTASLDMASNQLNGTITTVNFGGTHTLTSAYTGGLPFPEGLDFSNSGITVDLNASGDQSIPGGGAQIYNLTLSGSGAKSISSGTLTVGSSGGSVEVNPGTALVAGSGTTLSVSGATITMHADASSYGQVQVEGTLVNNSGSYVKEHYLDVSSARYYNMGPAVNGATYDNLPESGAIIVAGGGSDCSVWHWSAVNSNWQAPTLTSESISAFIGHTIFAGTANGADFLRGSSGTISIEGTGIYTGNQTQPITYDDGSSSTATLFDTIGTGWGWNFYSNPYTATYDWDSQTLPSGVTNAIYTWNGTNYATYNGAEINGGSRYLAPGQSFWLQATSSLVDVTWTMQSSQTTVAQEPSFLKTNPNYAKLVLSNSNGDILDESAVRFEPTATTQFDGQFDARKLPSSVGTPYTHIALNGEHYGICTTPNSTTDFPVTLKLNGGPNVLTFTLNEDNFSEFTDAILEDKSNGQFTQLMRGGSYSFTVNANDPEDRFVLHFNNNSVGIDEFGNTPITVGVASNQLFLFNQNVEAGSLVSGSILDLNGRTISQFNAEASTDRTTIQLPSLAAGIYMVRLSANNQTWTERIIIQ